MPEATLRAWLINDPAVAAMVGQRVFPVLAAPQSSDLPLITYQTITTEPTRHLEGDARLDAVRIQFNCVAATLAEARELGRLVRIALSRGNAGAIEASLFQGARDAPERVTDGSDQHTKMRILEFVVWHRPDLTPPIVGGSSSSSSSSSSSATGG